MKRVSLIVIAAILAVSIIPAAAFTQIQQPIGMTIVVENLGDETPTLNMVDNPDTTDAGEIGFLSQADFNNSLEKYGCDKYLIDFSKVPLSIARQQVMVIGGPKCGYLKNEQGNYWGPKPCDYGPYKHADPMDYEETDYIFELQNNHPDQNFKLWLILDDPSVDTLPPQGLEIEIWGVQKGLDWAELWFKIDHDGVWATRHDNDVWAPPGVMWKCSSTEDIKGNQGGYFRQSSIPSLEKARMWMVVKTDGTCELDDWHAQFRLIANTYD